MPRRLAETATPYTGDKGSDLGESNVAAELSPLLIHIRDVPGSNLDL
jgi:hypothetical protein